MASPDSASLRRLMVGVLLVPVIVTLALSAFAWSSSRLAPRDLPVGVVAPMPAAEKLKSGLQRGDAFDVHSYASESEAREAIRDRDVYGAFVVSPKGVTTLTATAASSPVAQVVTKAGDALAGQVAGKEATARTVDVVASDPDDPNGTGFSSSVLPLVLTGVLSAILIVMLSKPGMLQLGGLLTAAALAGVCGGLIVQSWLGVVDGNWAVNASVMGLTVFAISVMSAGSAALIGRAGMVCVSLLMVFLGNPFAGVSSAPEMLPEPAGWIGQMLPPGAGGNLLRGTAFFDGAAGAAPLTVLLVWAGLGVTGVLFGIRRSGAEPVGDDEPAPSRDVEFSRGSAG
ncbi:ABC transporter permease [Streptomyces sp. NPDC050844]|uniref:ABC transporter permease n=1 Tax=Streptomyces sp. NPDC050844 TaxID=3155790 RepID=UPI0033F3B3B1